MENEKLEAENQIESLNKTISDKTSEIWDLNNTIQQKKTDIIWMDDEILVQEFGLYTPQYEFASSLDYKEKLAEIRSRQRTMIKDKTAVSGNTNWQENGSTTKGRKMVSDTQKLLLRAFNSECDDVVS